MKSISILLVLFSCSCLPLSAQEMDPFTLETPDDQNDEFREYYKNYDSLPVEVRTFDTTTLSALQQDPELHYGYTRTALSLWDSFRMWLNNILRNLFRPEVEEGRWYDFFLFTAVTLIVVYAIMRLLKVNHRQLFYGTQGKKTVNQLIIEENIHEMDFETLLKEAVASHEHRKAIRLIYLLSLKLLADKHHIEWEPGKTNQDYLNEVTAHQLRPGFRELNYYFEYAWYGNFSVTPELFARVDSIFSTWKQKV